MSLGIFSSVGVWEIMLLMLVVLLVFGPKKLPTIGRSMGRGMREFKEAVGSTGDEIRTGITEPLEEIRATVDLTSYHGAEESGDLDEIDGLDDGEDVDDSSLGLDEMDELDDASELGEDDPLDPAAEAGSDGSVPELDRS